MVRPFDELEKEYPMKLYIYDHCPFCVRARMAAGLFGADVEEVVLANDDEATLYWFKVTPLYPAKQPANPFGNLLQ